MAIFKPGKDGDCMGSYAYQRANRAQRKEFAIAKKLEEEVAGSDNYYAVQRIKNAFDLQVEKNRKAMGLKK